MGRSSRRHDKPGRPKHHTQARSMSPGRASRRSSLRDRDDVNGHVQASVVNAPPQFGDRPATLGGTTSTSDDSEHNIETFEGFSDSGDCDDSGGNIDAEGGDGSAQSHAGDTTQLENTVASQSISTIPLDAQPVATASPAGVPTQANRGRPSTPNDTDDIQFLFETPVARRNNTPVTKHDNTPVARSNNTHVRPAPLVTSNPADPGLIAEITISRAIVNAFESIDSRTRFHRGEVQEFIRRRVKRLHEDVISRIDDLESVSLVARPTGCRGPSVDDGEGWV